MDTEFSRAIEQVADADRSELTSQLTDLRRSMIVAHAMRSGRMSDEDRQTVLASSGQGLSVIYIEFEWGTNLDFAAQDVRDKISFLSDLIPEG